MEYAILEDNLSRLEAKLTRISNKCKKYGCSFIYEKLGEQYKTLTNEHGFEYQAKFIIVRVEGTAVVNNWEFVASLEHTEKGNIINRISNIEVPERFYTSSPVCEHCKSNRFRKNTFIVHNTETGEFKQVGKSCLLDFTNGLSAEMAATYVSLFDTVIAGEAPVEGSSYQYYLNTVEYLQFVAETISKFGYVRRNDHGTFTADRAFEYYVVAHGGYTSPNYIEYRNRLISEMEKVKFNPERPEIILLVKSAMNWILGQDESNNYIHNLKTACSLEYITSKNFGVLASLFPTYNRELEYQAEKAAEEERRRKEIERNANSIFVGSIKERITVQVESIKCVTSFETEYGFMRIYKIVDISGNVFVWKTGNLLDENSKEIVGTVKAHNEFRGIKQTELTRCRVVS